MNEQKLSLDHLNLSVRNFEETADWYRKVFGFEIVEKGLYDGEPWGVLRKDDVMLCVYEMKGLSEPNADALDAYYRIYHFGLRIRDRLTWENTVKTHQLRLYYGGEIRYPHSSSWYIADPTGYSIEVALWNNDQVKFEG